MKHLNGYIKGSTLLELLIILVIVGLLVQFAIPQYQTFVQKAHGKERLADLLVLQTEMESCYFETMDYRECASQLAEPQSGYLEKNASRFEYRLKLTANDEEVLCSWFETNSEHEIVGEDGCL